MLELTLLGDIFRPWYYISCKTSQHFKESKARLSHKRESALRIFIKAKICDKNVINFWILYEMNELTLPGDFQPLRFISFTNSQHFKRSRIRLSHNRGSQHWKYSEKLNPVTQKLINFCILMWNARAHSTEGFSAPESLSVAQTVNISKRAKLDYYTRWSQRWKYS